MAAANNVPPVSLLDLLSNDLILRHTSPYIGITSLVSLAATSKTFKSLVHDTPQVFQHVDLYGISTLMGFEQYLSFDEPMLQLIDHSYTQTMLFVFTILENRNWIHDVRTLILDGLFVPIKIIKDLLCNERYQIRLLSLRGAYRLDIDELMRILRHLIRPSRPNGTPKLRGIYLFGQPNRTQEVYEFNHVKDRPQAIGITTSVGAQLGAGSHVDYGLTDLRKLPEDPYRDSPYGAPGPWNVLTSIWVSHEWPDSQPEILEACAGLISFDAVLCRHDRESVLDPRPEFATVRLTGCMSCGTCPEGPAYPGASPADHLPLLSPPPWHSSKVEVAQRMNTYGQPYPPLILRCRTCLKDRWCERCNAFWCESCYTIPNNRGPSKRDPASTISGPISNEDIKVHNGLCVSKCLMDELLNGVGEGGMWG